MPRPLRVQYAPADRVLHAPGDRELERVQYVPGDRELERVQYVPGDRELERVPYAPADRELVAEQSLPDRRDAPAPVAEPGLNLPLLVLLLSILAGVAASNVWLRRRAARDRQAGRDSPE